VSWPRLVCRGFVDVNLDNWSDPSGYTYSAIENQCLQPAVMPPPGSCCKPGAVEGQHGYTIQRDQTEWSALNLTSDALAVGHDRP
jgi:hypothetical protein